MITIEMNKIDELMMRVCKVRMLSYLQELVYNDVSSLEGCTDTYIIKETDYYLMTEMKKACDSLFELVDREDFFKRIVPKKYGDTNMI